MEIAFLVGRILFGGFFLMNGINHFTKKSMMVSYAQSKNLPMSGLLVILSGILLILAGLGVVFGVYVQESLAVIAGLLVVISFSMHAFWRDKDSNTKMSEMINFMKNMALLGATLMLYSVALPWVYAL